ncbi:MAG: hypothetical protein RL563_1527 [Pseudomonadota bacterium]
MLRLFLLLGMLMATLSFPVQAITLREIPEPLKPWTHWILEDIPQWQCPFLYENFQQKRCSWPGRLNLTLATQGGQFQGNWTLYRPDWVILPGDTQHWPQGVNSHQQALIVLEHQGKPAVWLPSGHYEIEGHFKWQAVPERLAIPEDTGLLNLSVNDKIIAYPRIEQSALWLNIANQDETQQANSLDLQVFRQIIDDSPLRIVTVLDLQVSGKAREVIFPHALLNAALPISLDSPLPARLESHGELRVQVRPGHWLLTLTARMEEPVSQLSLNTSDGNWPASELWAFQSMPALRLVEIESLPAIDGSQTNLPDAWRQLPVYRINNGQSMVFKTLRRGDPNPPPNQLNIKRRLWLDFDGGGYTVSDQITGKMSRNWRLDSLPELQIGQALLNGQQQLITQREMGHGVEVRRGELQLQADSRLEGGISQWHAVGWQQSFQQVSAELNIPPGWRLLAVKGVDNDPDCWLSQWTLLDVFLLLVITLAISRLWSWHWGALALISLTLTWYEADAPRWIWLNTLAALALLRVLPENRFATWVIGYRNLCWLALLASVIPFMVTQLRIGFYPQLEQHGQVIPVSITDADNIQEVASLDIQSMERMESQMPAAPARMVGKSLGLMREPTVGSTALDRIDPDAHLQTGPGLPTWQWRRVFLNWNGSVDPQHTIRLWYLPPFMNLVLHILQAALVGLMALKLMGVLSLQRLHQMSRFGLMVLIPVLMFPSPDTFADLPDAGMLEQLKQRLQQTPQCLPSCAEVSNMTLNLDGKSLQIEWQLHAQEALAVPLPARQQQWMPERITVDGHDAPSLIRQEDRLWLAVEAGVHKVLMQGPIIDDDKFLLALPLIPQYTQLRAEGWRVDGLYEQGKVGPQLEFNRLQVNDGPNKLLASTVFPPFVRIERTLHLGLDWRITTTVHQLGDSNAAVMLEVPLISGEAVTDPNIHVKEGLALVNMAAGQRSLSWESILDRHETIQLKTASASQWHEIWRIDISPIWHMESSGLDVVHHQDPAGSWLPEWHPWPNEALSLSITRPKAVNGATMTIDNSELSLKAGKRSEQVKLALTLRSSKGGQHNITLPHGAVLQNVILDGQEQTLRQQEETVTLPIHPGTQHIVLNWQTNQEQSMLLTTPLVNLQQNSVNSHIETILGEDRWVLITLGPQFGPAALIWGLLVVLAFLAWGLGHMTLTPLHHWQWFLLLIGLSQIHIGAAMLVVIWLVALGWRKQHASLKASTFNLQQILLGVMTLMALWLLFLAVQQGLLGSPDMQITGNQSSAFDLKWYQDHSGPELPTATIISVSLLWYRVLMLLWSLWMALSLLNWLRWGWECFSTEGVWRETKKNLPKTDDSSQASQAK